MPREPLGKTYCIVSFSKFLKDTRPLNVGNIGMMPFYNVVQAAYITVFIHSYFHTCILLLGVGSVKVMITPSTLHVWDAESSQHCSHLRFTC